MFNVLNIKALCFVVTALGVVLLCFLEYVMLGKGQPKSVCTIEAKRIYAGDAMILQRKFKTEDIAGINIDQDLSAKDGSTRQHKLQNLASDNTKQMGQKTGTLYAKKRAVKRVAGKSAKARMDWRVWWRRCWRMNPVSWTAKQLRSSCKVPKDFREKNSTVKRIVYFNKTVEYTVCSKSTNKCQEQPYYSWRLHKTIERPPCCIAHVLETFRHVTRILDRAKIPYFLTAGGLVGWVKGKSMPRYENDLDILVDKRHWGRFRNNVMTKVTKDGHVAKEKFEYFIRTYYSKTNRVFVDAWPYIIVKKNGSRWVKTESLLTWHDNPYSSIFPLRRSMYSGIPVWVPNDPESVLDRHYKKRFKWRKIITCKTQHKNKCTS